MGITVIWAVIGILLTLVAVKLLLAVVPEEGNPIVAREFVH